LELGKGYIAEKNPKPSIATETSYPGQIDSWYVTRIAVRKGNVVFNEV